MKPPLFIQTCFGLLGGIGAHPDDVMHMKRTADRLFGDNYRWSVLGAGRNQMPVAAMAAAMGGKCASASRTACGSAPASSRRPTPSQVTQVRKIIEGLGLEVATPDEAREILELKGGDRLRSERRLLALRSTRPPATRSSPSSASSYPGNGLAHIVFDAPGRTMNVFSEAAIVEIGLHRALARRGGRHAAR